MKSCGDNSCRYVRPKGMATNGGCRCDRCPGCGGIIRPPRTHYGWCPTPEWRSANWIEENSAKEPK